MRYLRSAGRWAISEGSTVKAQQPQMLGRAYAQLYDKPGDAIEVEIKEDKQGFDMSKRYNKKAEAQDMSVLLNALAHNVPASAKIGQNSGQLCLTIQKRAHNLCIAAY